MFGVWYTYCERRIREMNVLNLTFEEMTAMSDSELDKAMSECNTLYNELESQYTILKYKVDEVGALYDFLELLKNRRRK